MASAIESVLRRFGYSCQSVSSAEKALESLQSSPVDLLVSDVKLDGGASGLDLMAEAKSNDPDLAVLMVSGLDDPGTADAALDLGAFGYIIKPFGLNELRIGVSNALRRRELEIARRSDLAHLEAAVRQRTAELQTTSDDLRVREGRFRSLAQATPLGVLYVRTDGSCEYVNRRTEILLGRCSGDLDRYSWLAGMDLANREALQLAIHSALSGVPEADHEHPYQRPDESATWLHTRVAPVTGDGGEISGVLILFEEIEARRRLDMKLLHQAMHDHLTGLPNRRLLKKQLTERLSAAEDEYIGLLMIDLDQFKLVNDTYGHERGDEMIVATARRLAAWAGERHLVARLGGDEFVVLSQGPSPDDIAAAAQSVHDAISGPVRLGTVELHLTASIGVATQADAGASASDLMRGADVALHRAKERRNSIAFFNAEMARGISRRLAVGSELKRAIEDDSLTVHFQPIVDAGSKALRGVEALARWTHPEWGPVMPDEFIPIAESAGLVQLIDDRVLKEAVSELANWRQIGRVDADCFVSINLSGVQLTNSALPRDVEAVLRAAALPGACLCVEATETALVSDLERAVPVLEGLRHLGVRVAIDDFGTGHSSLAVLDRIPLDILKIDRSFVANLPFHGGGTSIIDTIIEIAHRRRLSVIAEGVEDGRQLDQLRELGCDMVQGYLIGRPQAANARPTAQPATREPEELLAPPLVRQVGA